MAGVGLRAADGERLGSAHPAGPLPRSPRYHQGERAKRAENRVAPFLAQQVFRGCAEGLRLLVPSERLGN